MSKMFSSTRKEINWSAIILFSLGFWLSGSFVLDFILIPCLSASGMMIGNDFPSAGFLIFGVFNHIEIVCASLILTGTLVFYQRGYFSASKQWTNIMFAIALLVIAFAYTYLFVPQLSAWGLLFNPYGAQGQTVMPSGMMYWQVGYWVLEIIKLTIAGILLNWHYRSSCSLEV